MNNPPHTSSGPLGGDVSCGMVPPSFDINLSGDYMPYQVSRGNMVHEMGNFGNFSPPSKGMHNMKM